MADVGDRVQIPSKRVGQAPREGVVVGVSGGLLRVEWSGGEQTTLSPSGGSLVVVGRVAARARKTPAQPGSRVTPRKTAGATARPGAKRSSGSAPSRARALPPARKVTGAGPKKAAASRTITSRSTSTAGEQSRPDGAKKQAVSKKAGATTAAGKKAVAKKGQKASGKKLTGQKVAGKKAAGKKAGAKKRSKHRK